MSTLLWYEEVLPHSSYLPLTKVQFVVVIYRVETGLVQEQSVLLYEWLVMSLKKEIFFDTDIILRIIMTKVLHRLLCGIPPLQTVRWYEFENRERKERFVHWLLFGWTKTFSCFDFFQWSRTNTLRKVNWLWLHSWYSVSLRKQKKPSKTQSTKSSN